LRQWDELADWLREQRHELQVADDVERADTAWKSNNKDSAWLLAGSRLADAEKVVSSPTFTQRMNPVREYLDASRQSENDRVAAEEERRHAELRNAQERQAQAEAHATDLRKHATDLRKRSRILRAVVAITAAVAVVAVVGLVYAISARHQAQDRFRQATSVRLASDADGMLNDTRPGSDARAIQELLAANALSPNTFEEDLYSVAVKTFNPLKIISPPIGVFGAIFSPDGRRFVTGGDNGILRL